MPAVRKSMWTGRVPWSFPSKMVCVHFLHPVWTLLSVFCEDTLLVKVHNSCSWSINYKWFLLPSFCLSAFPTFSQVLWLLEKLFKNCAGKQSVKWGLLEASNKCNWMCFGPSDHPNTIKVTNYSNNECWTLACIFTTSKWHTLAEWIDIHRCLHN